LISTPKKEEGKGEVAPLLDEQNVWLVQKLLKTPPPNILSPVLDFSNPIVTKPSPMSLHAIRALSGYFMATSHPPSLYKLVSIASLFFQDKLPTATTTTTTTPPTNQPDNVDYEKDESNGRKQVNLNELAVGNAACTELISLCLFHPKAFAVCVEIYNDLCDEFEASPRQQSTEQQEQERDTVNLQKLADRITLEHVIIETLNLKNQTL